jgi:hypothetical protein
MTRIRRVLLWSLGGLALLELVYVPAGVLLVESGQVDRWLNAHPEKRLFRVESAWTIIPGVIHVRGLHLVNQGRSDQLELTVDRAVGLVSPLELLSRRIHILGLQARGVEFRFRKRPRTPEEAAAKAAVVPPIEGIPFEPYSGPPRRKTKGGWTIVFTGTTVREIRDVWIGPFRLKGPAEVAASVTVGRGRDKRLSIRSADIRFGGGELLSAGETSLRNLDLRVRGRMEPFFTKQTRGRALLDLITARVDLSATGRTTVLLSQYFAKADWLELDSGERAVTAHVEIERGHFQPGGHVDLGEAPLRVDLAGFIAEGQASARLETLSRDGDATPDVHVTVAFADYGMHRLVDGPAVMRGEGLRIEARSPADLLHLPPEDFDGRLVLGKAEFPDLQFVNELIPGGAGLGIRGGRGTVDALFEIRKGFACQGRMSIATEGLVIDAGSLENAGNVTVNVAVPEGNLRDLTFALDGSHAALTDFTFTSAHSAPAASRWRGRLEVTEGTLSLGPTPGAEVRLQVAFSDTRPLVAFLSRDKPLGGWKEWMLTIDEITGEGVARFTRGTTVVRHLGLRSEKLDIGFRALIDSRGAFGKARARYGLLKAGIGLRGRDRALKVLRVGAWYRKDDIPGMPPLLPEFE